MQQVRCDLCGRLVTIETNQPGTCPSCGYALNIPAPDAAAPEAPLAAAPVDDVSDTSAAMESTESAPPLTLGPFVADPVPLVSLPPLPMPPAPEVAAGTPVDTTSEFASAPVAPVFAPEAVPEAEANQPYSDMVALPPLEATESSAPSEQPAQALSAPLMPQPDAPAMEFLPAAPLEVASAPETIAPEPALSDAGATPVAAESAAVETFMISGPLIPALEPAAEPEVLSGGVEPTPAFALPDPDAIQDAEPAAPPSEADAMPAASVPEPTSEPAVQAAEPPVVLAPFIPAAPAEPEPATSAAPEAALAEDEQPILPAPQAEQPAPLAPEVGASPAAPTSPAPDVEGQAAPVPPAPPVPSQMPVSAQAQPNMPPAPAPAPPVGYPQYPQYPQYAQYPQYPPQPGMAAPPSVPAGAPGYPPSYPGYPGYPGYPADPRMAAVPPQMMPPSVPPSMPLAPYPASPQAGQPGVQYPSTYPGVPVVPPQPPRRKANWVLIAVIVLVLLALVGAGVALALSHGANNGAPSGQSAATPTIAATATPSVPAGFTLFKDQGSVYSLDVPSDWIQTKSSSGTASVNLFASDQGAAAEILTLPSTDVDSQTIVDGFFSGASSGGSVTNKQGPTTVQQSGASWTQESGDTTVAGSSEHIAVLFAQHGSGSVLIAFLAPAADFDSINTQDFQPMFTSFQFLS